MGHTPSEVTHVTVPAVPHNNLGHIALARSSSQVGAAATAELTRGPLVTNTSPFATIRPAELTPAERAAAVAALLAAGLLRVLHPEHFSHPSAGENSQEKPGEST